MDESRVNENKEFNKAKDFLHTKGELILSSSIKNGEEWYILTLNEENKTYKREGKDSVGLIISLYYELV